MLHRETADLILAAFDDDRPYHETSLIVVVHLHLDASDSGPYVLGYEVDHD